MVKHYSPIRWRWPFEPNPSGVGQLGHVSRPSAASVPPPAAAGGGKAARPPCGSLALGRLPQRAERLSQLGGEQLGLLPRREVAAFVEPVVVDQLGVGPLRPASRRRVDLVGKDAHSDRDRDALRIEEGELVLPVEAGGGGRRGWQPVERGGFE